MMEQGNDTPSFVFEHKNKLLSMTDAALDRIATHLFSNDDYGALVVATESGGCAGQRYVMSVILESDYRDASDLLVLVEVSCLAKVRFIVTRNESVLYIAGMKIDYVSTETGGGFLFSNPQAVNSCGCGESFSVGVAQDGDG